MKFTLAILTVLVPFFVHAGGGGGLRPGMESGMVRPEIVYSLGTQNGSEQFAYGTLSFGRWDVKTISLPQEVISQNQKMLNALEQSKNSSDWVRLEK